MNDVLGSIREAGTAFTPWAALGLFLAALVRVWPALRKIKLEGDTSLRGDLMSRIGALEAKSEGLEKQLQLERDECNQRIADIVNKAERSFQALSAEVQILRHERNNETMSIDALLLMMEAAPDAIAAIIPRIKEQRAQRAQAIAQEKAAIPILKAKDGL